MARLFAGTELTPRVFMDPTPGQAQLTVRWRRTRRPDLSQGLFAFAYTESRLGCWMVWRPPGRGRGCASLDRKARR